MRLFTLLTALILFVGTSATDYSGTWVANVEKSQLGTPPPKSYVMKVEKTGTDAFLVTIDGVRADGREEHQKFTRTYDGKAYPVPGAPTKTETCTQVDPLTRHIVGKNNGKVAYVTDAKMAPDRKTMITHQTYFSPDGQIKEVRVYVFDRQ
jgi:hypothetical protein